MCTHPIRIRNNTKLYTDGTRAYIYVPCGHCEDCRAQRADEWYQRIMMEFAECERAGGKVVFTTLTYNDDHLPRFYYDQPIYKMVDGKEVLQRDSHGDLLTVEKSFPCFNKQHKDRFFNRMRKVFESKYGLTDNTEYKFKYIWPCEYGLDPNCTHRPHYHPLLFFPREYLEAIQKEYPNRFLNDAVKRFIERFWSDEPYNLGFVGWSKREKSCFVKNDICCLYVSKYMMKDVSFFAQPEVDEYMKGVKRSADDPRYQAVKNFLPTHWQSLHFGEGLTSYYNNVDTFINGLDFSKVIGLKESGKVQSGKNKRYQMPRYIEQKLLYDRDLDNRVILNEKGKLFKIEKFLDSINRVAKKYQDYSDIVDIRAKISDDDLSQSEVLKHFESVEQVVSFIKHYVHSDEKFKELALYNSVWSGLSSLYNDTFNNDLYLLANCSHDDFVKYSCEQYINNISSPIEHSSVYIWRDDGVFFDDKIFEDLKFSSQVDELYRFNNFHLVLDVIGEVQNIYRQRCHQSYLEDRQLRKKMNLILFNSKSA